MVLVLVVRVSLMLSLDVRIEVRDIVVVGLFGIGSSCGIRSLLI